MTPDAVLEVAIIHVTEGSEDAFVSAYGQARELIGAAEGVGSVRMHRGVETPTRFVLLVEWTSVAAHDEFRASDAFGRWRALIGPHFAGAPDVQHVVPV